MPKGVLPHRRPTESQLRLRAFWECDGNGRNAAEIGYSDFLTILIPVGPLELQIASTLNPGRQKDLEDATHLYTLFRETLGVDRLES